MEEVGVEVTGFSFRTAGGAGGGGIDLVLPLAPVLFGLGATLNAVYSTGQAVDNYRYWRDYYKNTGVKPRYPFRAGMYDWMHSASSGLYSGAYWIRGVYP